MKLLFAMAILLNSFAFAQQEAPTNQDDTLMPSTKKIEEMKRKLIRTEGHFGAALSFKEGEKNEITAVAGKIKMIAGHEDGTVKFLVSLDLRPLMARSKVEERLRESPILAYGISKAIQYQIAQQMHIPDPSRVPVPPALLTQEIDKFIATHVNDAGVVDASVHEVGFEISIPMDTNEDFAARFTLSIGKFEPLTRLDDQFRTNPAHGLFFQSVSQPTLRLKVDYEFDSNNRLSFYAQTSSDRNGAVGDPSGDDIIAYVQRLLTQEERLTYKPNAVEVGAVLDAEDVKIVIAGGLRPDRNQPGTFDKQNAEYAIVTFKENLNHSKLNPLELQVSANIERSPEVQAGGDSAYIKRINAMISKVFGRFSIGTQGALTKGSRIPTDNFITWLTGLNYVLFQKGSAQIGAGGTVAIYRIDGTPGTQRRVQIGVAGGWR